MAQMQAQRTKVERETETIEEITVPERTDLVDATDTLIDEIDELLEAEAALAEDVAAAEAEAVTEEAVVEQPQPRRFTCGGWS